MTRNNRLIIIITIILLSIIFICGVIFISPHEKYLRLWSNSWWTILSFLATVKLMFTAMNEAERNIKLGWFAFSAGTFSWFIGMVIWDYHEHVLGVITPFPTIATPFLQGLMPFFLAGFALFTMGTFTFNITFRKIADLVIALFVIILICSLIFYVPVKESEESLSYIMLALAYPFLIQSTLLFALLCLLQCRKNCKRRVLAIQITAIAILATAQTLYAYALLVNTYKAGHSLDVFWVVVMLLLIWSAYEYDWMRDYPVRESGKTGMNFLDAAIPPFAIILILITVYFFAKNWTEDLVYILIFCSSGIGISLSIRSWATYRIEMKLRNATEEYITEIKKAQKTIEQQRDGLADEVARQTRELSDRNRKLEEAIENIKQLQGLLPICSKCKKIRNVKGYWNEIEEYLAEYSEMQFSHSLCQDCMEELYGDDDWFNSKEKEK